MCGWAWEDSGLVVAVAQATLAKLRILCSHHGQLHASLLFGNSIKNLASLYTTPKHHAALAFGGLILF